MNPSQYRLMRTLEKLELDAHFLEGMRRGVRALSPDEAEQRRKVLERLQSEEIDLESAPAKESDPAQVAAVPGEPRPGAADPTISLRARRIREKLESGYQEQSTKLAQRRRETAERAESRGPQNTSTAGRSA